MNAANLTKVLNTLMKGPPQMTDVELAKCTGVAVNTLRRLISGQSTAPRRASLEPIADYFDISLTQLMGEVSIPPMGATLSEMEKTALYKLRAYWIANSEKLEITTEKAATSMGYKSQKVVHRYLTGKIPLNIDVIFKFAQILRVDSQDILEEMPELDSLGLSWWDGKERRTPKAKSKKKTKEWTGVDRRHPDRPSRSLVPLFHWDEVASWENIIVNRIPGDGSKWVPTPRHVGAKSFALPVNDNAMLCADGLSFPEGSVIIVDPEEKPATGSFVIATFTGAKRPVFRQLIIESDGTYLAPLNENFVYDDVSDGYQICGVVKAMFMDVPG